MLDHLFIEFDGQHLKVESDVARVLDYVAATYAHMLSEPHDVAVRTLQVMRNPPIGYRVVGAESITFQSDDVEPLLPHIKEEIRLEFIRSRPDLIWIHAGAVERENLAMILSGKSGNGKSTLVTLLCDRGWHLMSDDTAPIRPGTFEVLPFTQVPQRRIDPGNSVSARDVQSLRKETVTISNETVRKIPAVISCLVFLKFVHNATPIVDRLSKGAAAMQFLGNTTNFWDHRAAAVEEAVSLARRLPVFTVTYGLPERVADMLDVLPRHCE